MQDVPKISSDEITPPDVYYNRRLFMQAGLATASVFATGATYRWFNPHIKVVNEGPKVVVEKPVAAEIDLEKEGFTLSEEWTPEEKIISYNNFYEFTTNKQLVAIQAQNFKTDGWQIKIDGLVKKPKTITMDDLLAMSKPQERVYRMRCVEAWSIVVPWIGIPLAHVIEALEPEANAKYIAFETLHDPVRMPGQNEASFDWPYREGLRLDEAMHPLAILATGLYGKVLPPQDGAPVRLVVPWKYGFKSIKSIVRISLTEKEPPTTWNTYAPNEYGFYANVNPDVDHPRWSQATEQRLGKSSRQDTLMFNGYAEQVAKLYEGMDLTKFI